MKDYRIAIAAFFLLIFGIVLFLNQSSVVNTGYCVPAPRGSELLLLIVYEIVSYFSILAGILLMLNNLAFSFVPAQVTGFFTVLVIAAFLFFIASAGLGTFGSAALCPTSVITASGFFALSPRLNTTGNFTLTIGQSTGATMYNVGLACAAAQNATGLPNPTTALVYLSVNGSATGTQAHGPYPGSLSLVSGQLIRVTGLKCFDRSGTPLANEPIGSAYVGYLWINYTAGPSAPGTSNPMETIKFATVAEKAV